MPLTTEQKSHARDITDRATQDCAGAGIWFLAVRAGRWGRGQTIAEACRKCGGTGLTMLYQTTDAEVYVDGMGCTVHSPDHALILLGAFTSIGLNF